MKRLTATICLTIAVLLGSMGASWSASSEKVYERHFANVELQLPDLERLCLLRNIGNEKYILDYFKKILEHGGHNKFLLMWVDCNTHKKIQNGTQDGHNDPMSEWVTILAPYQNGKEKRFPNMNREQFFKKMTGAMPSIDWDNIKNITNENLQRNLPTKRIVKVEKLTSLGVLAFGSAIHTGHTAPISSNKGGEINNQFVIGISSVNYINNIHFNVNHYKSVNKNDFSQGIRGLLSQSINYSDMLLLKNK